MVSDDINNVDDLSGMLPDEIVAVVRALKRERDDLKQRKEIFQQRALGNANSMHHFGEQTKLLSAKLTIAEHERDALSERLAAVTAALVKQQDVEDHTLECLPCLHSDDCRIKDRLTADANVARADILAAGQPTPAAAEEA